MRILAIGDIHGCLTAFDSLLAVIKPRPGDTLVTLGDYVDRGPHSCGVLDRLLELQHTIQLVSLRGNHELMMLEAREDPSYESEWHRVGGAATLASYGPDATLEDIPQSHWDFIENDCLDYWESETHFFVHAGAYADMPLSEQPEYKLFWDKFDYPAPHISGKIMVCGHTCQKSGLPLNIGHAICLDTWAYGKGWLSCLDVISGQIWQVNEAGATRRLSF